jgi:hypothetical protein
MARRISAPTIAGSSKADNSFGITDGARKSCCSGGSVKAGRAEVFSMDVVKGDSLGAPDDAEGLD